MSKAVYGFKHIIVNNCVIHTLRISIRRTLFNEGLLATSSLTNRTTIGKKGAEKLCIEYTTLDITDFAHKRAELVVILRKVAQRNLDEKYDNMSYKSC